MIVCKETGYGPCRTIWDPNNDIRVYGDNYRITITILTLVQRRNENRNSG